MIRLVAVTQSDPFFTGRFFAAFLREHTRHPIELVEIVLLRNFNESKPALVRRLWNLYGPADFARLLGRYTLAKFSDRCGRPRTVEAVAGAYGIPIRRVRTINDESYLSTLARRQVDVLLSIAAPEIFSRAALGAAPCVLNVHSGKLPQYRGMMPTFWALHNGEDHVVVTVHEMSERIDAGNVIAEFTVPVDPEDSAFEVAARAKQVAGVEIARLVALLGTKAWPAPRPIGSANQRYYRFPTRRDALRLRSTGRPLL